MVAPTKSKLPVTLSQFTARADPDRRNDRCADQVKVTCHPERGVGVRKGAKDPRAARGSASRLVRRSFAPTRAPTLSLRMTGGWVLRHLMRALDTAKNLYARGRFSARGLNSSHV